MKGYDPAKHNPYIEFVGSPLWAAVERAVDDLIENRDLQLTTVKDFVVGYIVKQVSVISKAQE